MMRKASRSSRATEIHELPDPRVAHILDLAALNEVLELNFSGESEICAVEVCESSEHVFQSRHFFDELMINDRLLAPEGHPILVIGIFVLVYDNVADRLSTPLIC